MEMEDGEGRKKSLEGRSVAELKKICAELGIKGYGKKEQIVGRIMEKERSVGAAVSEAGGEERAGEEPGERPIEEEGNKGKGEPEEHAAEEKGELGGSLAKEEERPGAHAPKEKAEGKPGGKKEKPGEHAVREHEGGERENADAAAAADWGKGPPADVPKDVIKDASGEKAKSGMEEGEVERKRVKRPRLEDHARDRYRAGRMGYGDGRMGYGDGRMDYRAGYGRGYYDRTDYDRGRSGYRRDRRWYDERRYGRYYDRRYDDGRPPRYDDRQ